MYFLRLVTPYPEFALFARSSTRFNKQLFQKLQYNVFLNIHLSTVGAITVKLASVAIFNSIPIIAH